MRSKWRIKVDIISYSIRAFLKDELREQWYKILFIYLLPIPFLWLSFGDLFLIKLNDYGWTSIHSYPYVGLILCAAIWLPLVGIVVRSTKRDERTGCFAGILFFVFLFTVSGLTVQVMSGLPVRFPLVPIINQDIFDAVSLACNGVAIESVAKYQSTAGIHPIVLVNEGESPMAGNENKHRIWSDAIPLGWAPDSVEDVELIACVNGPREELIETCKYQFAASISRYQWIANVKIVVASTGAILDTKTFLGTPPRKCQSTESRGLTELHGENISFINVQDWLTAYVVVK